MVLVGEIYEWLQQNGRFLGVLVLIAVVALFASRHSWS